MKNRTEEQKEASVQLTLAIGKVMAARRRAMAGSCTWEAATEAKAELEALKARLGIQT